MGRLDDMSDSMLLRTIEVLARVRAMDTQTVFGIRPKGKGPSVKLNRMIEHPTPASSGPTKARQHRVNTAGQVLEAMEHVARYFDENKREVVDVTPEE